MSTRMTYLWTACLLLAVFSLAIILYPQMPDTIAGHWSASGDADGSISKFWGLFLLPIIALVTSLIFSLIPRIDPLKRNIKHFRKHYNLFMLAIVLFLAYFYELTVAWNLGLRFSFSAFAAPAVGVLFFIIGSILPHTERNWFFGIRTPWTLSSDKVWEETHRVGGYLFRISGVIAVAGMFFPSHAIWIALLPVLTSVIVVISYSYIRYRNEME